MATLKYRGADVTHETEAMKQNHIASYRGVTYNTEDIELAPKATSGNYRGSKWSA